jgi:hypothetical protein
VAEKDGYASTRTGLSLDVRLPPNRWPKRSVGSFGWNAVWAPWVLRGRRRGSHRGNYKGPGSAGGPETRMKRKRGTQRGQRMAGGSEFGTSSGSRRHHLISKAKTRRREGRGGPTAAPPVFSSRGFERRRGSLPASHHHQFSCRPSLSSAWQPIAALWAGLWVGSGNSDDHQPHRGLS